MLTVTYEAVEGFEPGRLAAIDECRGKIRIRLDKHAPLANVVRQLNIEIDKLLASSHWFQLWKGEIVSRATPKTSLRVEYVFHPHVPSGVGVGVTEDKGIVRVYINPSLDTVPFAAAMNPATKDFLDGGQWFQLYAGEIVDNSPEPMSQV